MEGVLQACIGETVRISSLAVGSHCVGLVVQLFVTEQQGLLVGGLLLNPEHRLGQGAGVRGCGRLATVMVGDYAMGSLLCPLGSSVFSCCAVPGGPVWSQARGCWLIAAEDLAAGIIDRQAVCEALGTGVLAVDSMIPIGRGQRELLVGDRGTGKTSLALDTLLNQRYSTLFAVYIPIGHKAQAVVTVALNLIARDAVFFVSCLEASASQSAVAQFVCAYAGSSLGEFYMHLGELPSFAVHDDLSRHAQGYREIYLLLGRRPGREAYPGEIFYVHSRLLERSAKLAFTCGGGSLTALPVVETLAGDVAAYISTNVISITDGQLFLSADLFLSGQTPAIDVGNSVTRVGSAAQWPGMKQVAGSTKVELAQYVELQSFAQFAADVGKATAHRMTQGRRLLELFKQRGGSPMTLHLEVAVLSLANQDFFIRLQITDVQPRVRWYLDLPVFAFLWRAL